VLQDHERFSKIASGVQSIIVAAAVLVGGGWALFVFEAELRVDNAQAQLVKLKRELETRPVLDISIDAKQVDPDALRHRILMVTVVVSNKGTRDVDIDVSRAPLRATRIILPETGDPVYGDSVSSAFYATSETDAQKMEKLHTLLARVGDTDRIQGLLNVGTPGLYLIEFVAGMAELPTTTPESKQESTWLAQSFVVAK
jgi:hypothetical protein